VLHLSNADSYIELCRYARLSPKRASLEASRSSGGSTAVGLVRVFFRWSFNVGVLLALLYAGVVHPAGVERLTWRAVLLEKGWT
jgi:hypothetical protein